MFFTWSSAVKEIQRQNNAGNHSVRMKKRWYGWLVVHPSNVQNQIEQHNKEAKA